MPMRESRDARLENGQINPVTACFSKDYSITRVLEADRTNAGVGRLNPL